MTDAVKIYHNPRCSKSRETLSLLQSRGIDPEVVLYLETPPDAGTLRQLLQLLGMESPRELMRQKEDLYKIAQSGRPGSQQRSADTGDGRQSETHRAPYRRQPRPGAYWPPAGTGS